MSENSNKYDIVLDDDGLVGISEKDKNTIYKGPFRILDTYVAAHSVDNKSHRYPIIFADLQLPNKASELYETIKPHKPGNNFFI